jgi:hypothetical protein
MNSAWNIGKLRKGRLLRAVALLFLIHTGVDLFFPELCTEEPFSAGLTQSLALPSPANSKERSPAVTGAPSGESKDEQRSDPQHRDEDCFCCCAHVMPSPLFVTPDNAELVLMVSKDQNTSIPAAPPHNPYHPPRFA